MLSQEIQQHLAADQESDLLNNSSAIEPIVGVHSGVSPRVDAYQSRSEMTKMHGSAHRYGFSEQDEMRKNLDPLIFADKEFANELLEDSRQTASATSFI